MTMGSDEQRSAAEDLFERYPELSPEDFEAALGVFAHGPCPVYDAPRRRWLVADHAMARQVLRDPRFGNDLSRSRTATNSDRLNTRLRPDAPSLLFIDPPLHDTIKTELAELFTQEAITARQDELRQRWLTRLGRLRGTRPVRLGELVHPVMLDETLDVLGIELPGEIDRAAMIDDLFHINMLFDLNTPPEVQALAREANHRVRRQVAGALPGSAVEERMRGGGASPEIIVSTVVFMLRAAVVTLGSMLMSALAERLAGSGGDDSLHAQLIRHTPTGDTGRVALRPVRLGEAEIDAGETVIVLLGAANVDLLDHGGSVASHLVLGAGQHRCVGERLVRNQLRLVQDVLSDLQVRAVTRSSDPHRTPTIRGYRDIEVCPVAHVDPGSRP